MRFPIWTIGRMHQQLPRRPSHRSHSQAAMTTMSPMTEELLTAAIAAEDAAVCQRFLASKRRINLLAAACQYDVPNVEFCQKLSQLSGVAFLDVLEASYGDEQAG